MNVSIQGSRSHDQEQFQEKKWNKLERMYAYIDIYTHI